MDRISRFDFERALMDAQGVSASTRLVLHVLACHADSDTLIAYPSMETLSRRTSMSKKSCITHIAKAVDQGWIRRTMRGKAAGQQWRNAVYQLAIPIAQAGETGSPQLTEGGEPTSPHSAEAGELRSPPFPPKDAKVVNLFPEGGELGAKGGELHDQKVVNDVHPVSTKNISKNRGKITFAQFLENCTAKGEDPIPADDAVFKYAERVALPRKFVELAWRCFEDQYIESSKLYCDWRATFRTCVRRNWFNFWAERDGQIVLTPTKGQIAMREYAHA